MYGMTRKDLNEDARKEYDRIVDAMMNEIEAIPPLPSGVLSCKHGNYYRGIEKKYLPKLAELLNEN